MIVFRYAIILDDSYIDKLKMESYFFFGGKIVYFVVYLLIFARKFACIREL